MESRHLSLPLTLPCGCGARHLPFLVHGVPVYRMGARTLLSRLTLQTIRKDLQCNR